jgi:DNA-binding MarR family transcriptional regulator
MRHDRLRETLFYALEKSIKAYRQYAQARISDAGVDITIDQWLVLKTLQENPDAPLQQIAVMVFKDFASITRIMQLLVAKGFVRRTRHAQDGRRSALTLTRAGEQTIRALEPIIHRNRRSALRGITRAGVKRTQALLERIVDNCQSGDAA